MTRSDRIVAVSVSALGLLVLSAAAFGLEPPLLAVSVSAFAAAAMFAVLAFGLVMLEPSPPGAVRRRLGLVRGRLAWPVVLLAVAGTLALSNVLEALIDVLGMSGVGNLPKLDADLAGARGAGLGGSLAAVALAAGTAEELFFRGYVQRGLERRLAAWRRGGAAALLGASALFAAAHFDPVHSPAAFALGLYLGGITRLADSLWPAITCHVVNNAAAVLDAAYAPELPGPALLWAAVAAATVAVSLIVAARRRRPAHPDPASAPPEAATAGPSIDRP